MSGLFSIGLRFIIPILLLLSTCFAQEILRPTADFDPGNISLGCAGTNQASGAMANSHDSAGLTTSSSLGVSGDDLKSNASFRTFRTWQATGNIYSALTLNVNASFSATAPSNGCIKYSADGGVTYLTVKCSSISFGVNTYTITLDPAQDFTKLRVTACVSGGRGNSRAGTDPGFENISIADIWTVGTNPSPASGNGSTAGQAHRGVVVTN